MNAKASKRRSRKTNSNEDESDKKMDDSIDQSDDNKSTISTDTDRTDKDNSLKEDLVANREEIKESKIVESQDKVEESVATNGETVSEEILLNEEVTNGNTKNSEGNSTSEETEIIVLDTDESELQFSLEPNSDQSESPTLNRCKTRRSHTRHVPTPKTPKAELNVNGETAVEDLVMPEVIITPPEDFETEHSDELSLEVSIEDESVIENEEKESDIDNASTIVNFGNDTTKHFDVTVTSNGDQDPLENSNFLEIAKEQSYGETLRCLSGRKTLRKFDYQSNLRDYTDGSSKYNFTSGVKRKADDLCPTEKRARTDGSPGLLSYFTSPFRFKLNKTEIPSSTPKLMAYKIHHGSTAIDEVSKIGGEVEEKVVEKMEKSPIESNKWCSIM